MSQIGINQVLDQIRLMQDQVRSTRISAPAPGAADFGSLLKQSIDSVNQLQQTSGKMQDDFEKGVPGVNLSDVMIASEKAGIAFQGMLQVRNKVVDAYKEVMNMSM